MARFLVALLALGLLGAATATRAPAACRRYGTQLECDVGGSQMLIGTQAAAEPASGGFRPNLLFGTAAFDHRLVPDWPFRIEIQNIGVDPTLCRRLGNETYCY